jgi:cytidylate kinase
MLAADVEATRDRAEKTGVVVAIDGPAGAGKSTLARGLAARLGLPYVNTGLMYRAVAAEALRQGVDPAEAAGLVRIAEGTRFAMSPGNGVPELAIEDRQPGPELATQEVESIVSDVSRHPEVRAILRRVQRELGAGGCVMEGRDIGTVVFPDADVKIFLSAAGDVRAHRREEERGGGAEVGEAIGRRDALDGRTSPLEPAPDAHVLDTTSLNADEVLARSLDLATVALGRRTRG